MNKVYITGMNELNRNLNQFEDKIARKHLKDSLRTVSKPIIRDIKSNITGKINKRTGTLLRSIGSWFFKDANTVYVGPKTGRRAKYDAWYAHFLEFGTSGNTARIRKWTSELVQVRGVTVRRKKGITTGYKGKGGGIQARPFMRPAWDSNKSSVMENLRLELKRRLAI